MDVEAANALGAENVIALRRPHVCDLRPAWPLVDHDRLVALGLRKADDSTYSMHSWVRLRDGSKGYIWGCPGCGKFLGDIDVTRRGWAGMPFAMPKETGIGQRLETVYLGFLAFVGRNKGQSVILQPIIEFSLHDLSGHVHALHRGVQDARAAKSKAWRFGADGDVVTASRVVGTGPEVAKLRRTTSRVRRWTCHACETAIPCGVEHWTSIHEGRHRMRIDRRFCTVCVAT